MTDSTAYRRALLRRVDLAVKRYTTGLTESEHDEDLKLRAAMAELAWKVRKEEATE